MGNRTKPGTEHLFPAVLDPDEPVVCDRCGEAEGTKKDCIGGM